MYYDGRDLKHLNLKQVRRKIGAVPQSVRLHPQDLWDNIVAHHEETTGEEVWRAARTAGIEREIKAMPMGMMTMVGAGGSVLSGGESQRVTIARSQIGSPRIMLLDEATNWLDNESQAEVMQNLALLTSTRIVIAHRLSTLRTGGPHLRDEGRKGRAERLLQRAHGGPTGCSRSWSGGRSPDPDRRAGRRIPVPCPCSGRPQVLRGLW